MPSARFIMVASSVCLALAGAACLFLPTETFVLLGLVSGSSVFVQVTSALYLGFAVANWTARGSMIGGIYARPLSLANFWHFVVGSLVLVAGIPSGRLSVAYVVVILVYLMFAILFANLLFGRFWRVGRAED